MMLEDDRNAREHAVKMDFWGTGGSAHGKERDSDRGERDGGGGGGGRSKKFSSLYQRRKNAPPSKSPSAASMRLNHGFSPSGKGQKSDNSSKLKESMSFRAEEWKSDDRRGIAFEEDDSPKDSNISLGTGEDSGMMAPSGRPDVHEGLHYSRQSRGRGLVQDITCWIRHAERLECGLMAAEDHRAAGVPRKKKVRRGTHSTRRSKRSVGAVPHASRRGSAEGSEGGRSEREEAHDADSGHVVESKEADEQVCPHSALNEHLGRMTCYDSLGEPGRAI